MTKEKLRKGIADLHYNQKVLGMRKGFMNLITVEETHKLRRGFIVEVLKTKCKCENKQIHNLIKDEDIGLDLFQAMTEDYNYYVDEILGRCRDCDTEVELGLHYTVTHEE